MKAARIIGIVALAMYFGTYPAVRYLHSRKGLIIEILTNKEERVAYVRQTQIYVPHSGIKRPLKFLLYWAYYPLGKLDERFTGRGFRCIDAAKNTPWAAPVPAPTNTPQP